MTDTQTQQDAFARMRGYLDSLGFDATATSWLWSEIQGGASDQGLLLDMQQQNFWKTRFAGNDVRIRNGLAPLNPAEYLATETSYKSLFRNYGLPSGMYDNPDDFANLIGNAVSPDELKTRIDLNEQVVNNAPTEVKQALSDFYGVNDAMLLGYLLDPKTGTQRLQRQVAAAQVGGAASLAGFGISSQQAERYASLGVGFDQAMQGFGQVRQETSIESRQSYGAGPQVDQQKLQDAALLGDPQALEAIRRRRSAAQGAGGMGGGPVTTQRGVSGLGSAR